MAHRLTDDLPANDAAGDVRRGLLMLRAVDFAHRIARLIGGPDLIEAGVGRLAGRAAEVLLDDTAGPRVAEIVGSSSGMSRVSHAIGLRSALASQSRSAGMPLSS